MATVEFSADIIKTNREKVYNRIKREIDEAKLEIYKFISKAEDRPKSFFKKEIKHTIKSAYARGYFKYHELDQYYNKIGILFQNKSKIQDLFVLATNSETGTVRLDAEEVMLCWYI